MLMPSEVSVRERASVLVKRFYAHARRFESATSPISSDYLSTIEHHLEDAVGLGLLPELANVPFGKKLDIAVGYQSEHYVRDFQDILFEVDTSPDSFDAKTYIPGEFNAESQFIPIFYDYAGPVFDRDRMSCIAAGLEGVAVAIESRLVVPPLDAKTEQKVINYIKKLEPIEKKVLKIALDYIQESKRFSWELVYDEFKERNTNRGEITSEEECEKVWTKYKSAVRYRYKLGPIEVSLLDRFRDHL